MITLYHWIHISSILVSRHVLSGLMVGVVHGVALSWMTRVMIIVMVMKSTCLMKMMMLWKGCWDLVGSGSGSGTTEAVDDSNFGCSPLGEGGQCAHACIFANTNLDKYKYIQSRDNRSPFIAPARASIFTSEFLQIHDCNIRKWLALMISNLCAVLWGKTNSAYTCQQCSRNCISANVEYYRSNW